MKSLPLVLVLALVLAIPAQADEKEAETSFHEAYVQEVIDGHVADAAKTYLALMENEATPTRIRAESRFRFAVCAVLLGRADEARAQLAQLLADESTPAAVRVKAESYQASIAALGVGSELERKLQSLVFDLGRKEPGGPVPAYRDFEIIGDRAIPFLRKLLEHRDERLRCHAFRLLCRMNAEGMGEAWSPAIPATTAGMAVSLGAYLGRNPAEVPALERKLLTMSDEELGRVTSVLPLGRVPFSSDFVADLVERPAGRAYAIELLQRVADPGRRYALIARLMDSEDPALRAHIQKRILARPDLIEDQEVRHELLLRWLRSGDPEVSDPVAYALLQQHNLLPEPLEPDVYGILVRKAMRMGNLWYRPRGGSSQDAHAARLTKLSDEQSGETLLDALQAVVESGLEPGEDDLYSRRGLLTYGLGDLLATSLEQRPLEEIDLPRYTDLVKRWARIFPVAFPLDTGKQYTPSYPSARHWRHLKWLLAHLPGSQSDALARWLLEEVERQRTTALGDRAFHYLGVLHVDSPDSLWHWHAAYEATDDDVMRRQLIERLPLGQRATEADLKRAFVKMIPEIVAGADDDVTLGLAGTITYQTDEMEEGEAAEVTAGLLRAMASRPDATRAKVIDALTATRGRRMAQEKVRFLKSVWPKAVRLAWKDLAAPDREKALANLFYDWSVWGRAGPRDDEAHVAFLRDHLGEPGTSWQKVVSHPEIFPVELWVPRAPSEVLRHSKYVHPLRQALPQGAADEAARQMTRDLAAVNENVYDFVRTLASPEVQTGVLDRLLTSGTASQRALVLSGLRMTGGRTPRGNPTAKGLEAALEALLVEEKPNLDHVRMVATALEPLKPSRKLLPAARLLLAAESRENLLAGIRLAGDLAQPELEGALRQLYVTTLDSRIREEARKAMRTIADLAAVRAGLKPP